MSARASSAPKASATGRVRAGRMIPENVAPLAVYLCTERFAENINCNVFGVRGGSIYLYSNPQAGARGPEVGQLHHG